MSKSTDNLNKGNEEKNKKRIIFIILSIIIIVLLGSLIGSERLDLFDTGVKEGTFPTDDEQLLEFLKEKQDASKFTTNILPEAVYSSRYNILHVKIANPEKNAINCFIKVEVNDECYYTSGLIKPNQYIDNIKLDKPLPEGTDAIYVSYNEKLQDGSDRVLTTVEVHCTWQ